MTINPDNDHVEIFSDKETMWRWRRVDDDNGRIVAVAGEGYVSRPYAEAAALAYCPGCEIRA